METLEQMRLRHRMEMEALIRLCGHDELSDWVSSPEEVKTCKRCEKVVERRDVVSKSITVSG